MLPRSSLLATAAAICAVAIHYCQPPPPSSALDSTWAAWIQGGHTRPLPLRAHRIWPARHGFREGATSTASIASARDCGCRRRCHLPQPRLRLLTIIAVRRRLGHRRLNRPPLIRAMATASSDACLKIRRERGGERGGERRRGRRDWYMGPNVIGSE